MQDEDIHTDGEEGLYFKIQKVRNKTIKAQRWKSDRLYTGQGEQVREGALPLPWTLGFWAPEYWLSSP